VPEDFVIARNPEDGSSLPYILRVPYGEHGILLKVRETWPRTSKVYCHRMEEWPEDAEIVERVPTRSCTRRGAAIDLVLDRGRENRSQFVMSYARGGRQAIFWQTARTTKQARPSVRTPTARASGIERLDIVVDSQERYAWAFGDHQVTTSRSRLSAGDYAVLHEGEIVGAVERKNLGDLVSSLTTGKLRYQLAALADVAHAAVVVEDRYSQAFRHRIVRPSVIAEGLAECQVAFPNVPIVFCETRKLAQEWTYRFLGAALAAAGQDEPALAYFDELPAPPPLEPRAPTNADIRAWASAEGLAVSDRGRVPVAIKEQYRRAHGL
jgi:ERCC4 domain/Lsr2